LLPECADLQVRVVLELANNAHLLETLALHQETLPRMPIVHPLKTNHLKWMRRRRKKKCQIESLRPVSQQLLPAFSVAWQHAENDFGK